MPVVSVASSRSASARVGEEVLLEQQVLGGIAGEGQLGEHHEVGPVASRRLDPVADQLRVACDVPDGGVDLAQRQAHRPGPAQFVPAGRLAPERESEFRRLELVVRLDAGLRELPTRGRTPAARQRAATAHFRSSASSSMSGRAS